MDLPRLINPIHPGNHRRWQLEVLIGTTRYPLRATITSVEYPQEQVRARFDQENARYQYRLPFIRTSGRLVARTERLQDLEVVREVWDFTNQSERARYGGFLLPEHAPTGNIETRNQTVILSSDGFSMTFGRCVLIAYELNPVDDAFGYVEYRAGFEWLYQTLEVELNGREVPGFQMSVSQEMAEQYRSEYMQDWPSPIRNPGEEFLWATVRPAEAVTPWPHHRPLPAWNPSVKANDKLGIFEDWQTLGF